ncbi:MAG TPA: tetratricopeptide repeat protein, partial [Lachnospiraceae bacterium]|nr:tetratricopeptide repeat protein [Lachnospiraceae bacterium]
VLVEYQPITPDLEPIPSPAQAAKEPEEIMTNEELYLTGLHMEQYRHATYMPDPYYMEALKRDKGDIRVNNAYGTLLMRRGCFIEAEKYLRKALERSTWKNPNPYNSEPYYNLGLVLFYQEKYQEAYDAFYKATWTNEQQEMSFYFLAAIDTMRGEYEKAEEHINRGLIKNTHNIKARGLKAYIYRKLGKKMEALELIKESLAIDSFDYVSMSEQINLVSEHKEELQLSRMNLMRDFVENYLQTARDYAEFGAYEEAIQILSQCSKDYPMINYYKAYYSAKLGFDASELLASAEKACSDYCFPNKLEDIIVLTFAMNANPSGSNAYYYLGNLFYDRVQYDRATELWERSAQLNSNLQIVLRNLALAYYNRYDKPEKARDLLEKAFQLDTSSSRIFLELDQLYKKMGEGPQFRIENYERYKDTFKERDDLYIEYITLHNMLGRYEDAYQLMLGRRFHPWEGGEGKIVAQYTFALVQMAKKAILVKEYETAYDYLQKALIYPENLGEGKLEGTKDNHIYYYLGIVKEALGDKQAADAFYHQATIGNEEPAGVMYYNDQPADMILYQGLAYQKLGDTGRANEKFTKLIDYGERHIFDDMKIEYFAVSLPDFLIFNDDLKVKNQVHCYYLIGLGQLGFGKTGKAREYFDKALKLDSYHQNCMTYRQGGI